MKQREILERKRFTMEELIHSGAISREAAAMLKGYVESGSSNIFVTGSCGAGKTTFLSALMDYIPKDSGTMISEFYEELCLPDTLKSMRPKVLDSTPSEFITATQNFKPERVVIGEINTHEMFLPAMSFVESGCPVMGTIIATSVRRMAIRTNLFLLEAPQDVEGKSDSKNKFLTDYENLVICMTKFNDGSRRVTEIGLLVKGEGDDLDVNMLYKYDASSGQLEPVRESLIKRKNKTAVDSCSCFLLLTVKFNYFLFASRHPKDTSTSVQELNRLRFQC